MEAQAILSPLLCICFLLAMSFFFVHSFSVPPLLGVHPLDEKYYASEVIKCKDGSKVFSRDRLNDNFCDCVDGTDEPGTSACPAGKFYCRNLGSTPQFIFSSRVNDRICDCCDGSDEYDGSINCPATCIMGGNFVYKSDHGYSKVNDLGNIYGETKSGMSLDDLIEKLRGLKVVIILQLFLISCVVVFRIFQRRARRKRRGYHWSNQIQIISIMVIFSNTFPAFSLPVLPNKLVYPCHIFLSGPICCLILVHL